MQTLFEPGPDPSERPELLARLAKRAAAARRAREGVVERDAVKGHLEVAVVVDLVAIDVYGRA